MACPSGTAPLSLRPIAAALAASLTLAPLEALATQTVSNCNDSGGGSLRAALGAAADGELIDATGLVCGTISLSTGVLIVANDAQKIDGPGADKLTIDAAGNTDGGPVFFHNGSKTLEIDHVTVSHGHKYNNDNAHNVGGGCISSQGNVTLTQTVVSDCTMTAGANTHAKGGAIFALGDVTLTESRVTGNSTHGASPFGYEMHTYGGGIFSNGTITLDHSTVSGNHAYIGGGIYSDFATSVDSSTISGNTADQGGAIDCRCALQISYSTISNNHARTAGAIELQQSNTAAASPMFIRNSTISGNTISGGIFSPGVDSGVPITISNSTIAFNVAGAGNAEGALYSYAATLTLQSTIVSDNYPFDVDVQGGTTAISGAKNLVPNPSPAAVAALPFGTQNACPLLQPLAWNGGPTQTLALRSSSPAIGAGNNLIPLFFDQRGSGFPRVHGINPDVGAFEWQGNLVDDSIFRGTFEPGLCHL
jgi:hypothetical protein